MKDYLKEEKNCNIPEEDQIKAIIEEYDQKLKTAIWDQMEFLSEDIGIDNPERVIDTIRDSVEEYFAEYSPKDESFEEMKF